MEEAERLCDRLAIMAKGQIAAEGTCSTLISALGSTTIRFEMPRDVEVPMLCAIAGANFTVRDNIASTLLGEGVQEVLLRLLTWSTSSGTDLVGLEIVRPTLNDVFLGATGSDE
jgi:ABC-2 type transport system ATP-binding protein